MHNGPFMARFRIFWLDEGRLESFREKPPRNGPEPVRIRHYEEGDEIEAVSPYDAWLRLQGDAPERVGRRPLGVGDVLQTVNGETLICRYWGFEGAVWIDPENLEPSTETMQALS
jgi:hypothetical protein